MAIRQSTAADFNAIHAIINDGAQAYRGHIPPSCWHEPYMGTDELRAEIADGVEFLVLERSDAVCAVMGSQQRPGVTLIRHAYVAGAYQRQGCGAALLRRLLQNRDEPVLIGTWSAATWAIDFYTGHGFSVVGRADSERLLQRFWRVPPNQIANSVVLANQPIDALA